MEMFLVTLRIRFETLKVAVRATTQAEAVKRAIKLHPEATGVGPALKEGA